MSWDFNNSVPIYIQLIEALKMKIISGEIKPGERLQSVRELAENAGVNPNTMQRALSELERDKLIFSVRTSGRFVTEDNEMIAAMKSEIAAERIDRLFDALLSLGYTEKEIGEIVIKRAEQLKRSE